MALREWLTGRTGFFAFVHNSGWLLLDNSMRVLLGLLVGAWVTWYLGPTQFGELAYVLAYVAFFLVVANLGMDSIIVRDISRDRKQAVEILGICCMILQPSRPSRLVNSPNLGDSAITGPNDILGY